MAPYLFQQYGQERGFMEDAADRAPALAREDYFDIGQLAQVGAAKEGKAGEVLGHRMARHDFEQNEQADRLARYMAMVMGNYGQSGSTTQTTQQRLNPWLVGSGAALGLAGAPTSGGGSLIGSAVGK
jgi:hypothetical protein